MIYHGSVATGVSLEDATIDSDGSSSDAADDRVFNLYGILVGTGADALRTLAPGIYISSTGKSTLSADIPQPKKNFFNASSIK